MKSKLLPFYIFTLVFCLLSFVFSYSALSQVPQGFNYQAIVRDGTTKQPIVSQPILVRITIETATETAVYQETHSLSTDEFGIMAIVIGNGTPTGTDLFEDIDWNEEPLYIKTELQYPVGGSYTEMGTAPLISVPYAMVADEVETKQTLSLVGSDLGISDGNTVVLPTGGSLWTATGGDIYRPTGNVGIGTSTPSSKLSIQPPVDWEDNTPLFEVKNKSGIPVLSVYNYGVRILVDHTYSKAVKGGFAIGGYDYSKAGKTIDLMTISPDSIRFNINNDNAKGVKGGFAIGGFDITSKGPINEDFMYITPQNSNDGKYNTFMGYKAGNANTSGTYNVFMGYLSGYSNIGGNSNTILGHVAGYHNQGGNNNVFLGDSAGFNSNSDGNVFIGRLAGADHVNGAGNTYIGTNAGRYLDNDVSNVIIGYHAGGNAVKSYQNVFIGQSAGLYHQEGAEYNTIVGNRSGVFTTTGKWNTFLGYASGYLNETGENNTYLGKYSGKNNADGSSNIFIGEGTGELGTTGSSNVYVGRRSGYNNRGSNNVFIGHYTGSGLTNVSDKLYIDNSNTGTPLIYGDFATGSEKVIFYGNVGIGISPGTNKFSISGLAGSATGTPLVISGNDVFYSTSRRNSKENIIPLIDDFEKILNTQPVSFTDKITGNPGIGYIAEDFETAGLQNLLVYENGELISLRYDLISVYNLEIIKQQQAHIKSVQQENRQLKSELESLKQRMAALESIMGKN